MTDPRKSDEQSIEDLADRRPGADDNAPYEDRTIENLPGWWQDAIREFDEYDVRAFQPSQFEDGVIVEPLLSRLEAEYDVTISLYGDGVEYGDPWTLSVDGNDIATVGHRRSSDGYSVFTTSSGDIIKLVTEHVRSSSQ